MAKKLYIKTYGCQANVYDSARMADVLAARGFTATDNQADADLVILNTCHIREKASEKVFSELGRLKLRQAEEAKAGRRLVVAVAGCVAQAEGDDITRRAPNVDIVVGPQAYHRLGDMVAATERRGTVAVDTEFSTPAKFANLPKRAAPQGVSAYLTVQEGCDKFCAFCVVPYTRGGEYSRPVAGILAEARRMVDAGAREITLLGQNVNAFHGPGPDGAVWSLGRLLRALSDFDGLWRLRYTTSHPLEMDDELIGAHRDVARLMPFLHLPIQSGSDRVLAAMNRRHRTDDYRRVVARLRAARPDMALSSDFIVGFPGETAADFNATMRLVREIGFAQAYSFKYSARPGTPAAGFADAVPEAVKIERLGLLREAIAKTQLAYNQAAIGRVMPVLFDRRGRHAGQMSGRSPYMQSVYVAGASTLHGRIRDVRIHGGYANSLFGRVEGEPGIALDARSGGMTRGTT